MREFVVATLDELLTRVRDLTEMYGSRIWFRGQEKSEWELVPSIQRSGLQEHEAYISNDFYIKVKQVTKNPPPRNSYATWLSMMQHYGLPTRLLDWSMSPLIAAFFATERWRQYEHKDACVWALFPRSLNALEGFGDYVLPNDAYSVQEMTVRAFKSSAEIGAQFEDKIMACCSTENDLRMYSQQSAFTVHNSLKKLTEICSDDMLFKMIIPSERRGYFLQSLDYFGINEGFIYPDMEHIARDIKARYNIRNTTV